VLVCVRGATTVKCDEEDEILGQTTDLLNKIMAINNFKIDDIVSILFSVTKDLTKVYPAKAARNIGIVNSALMCVQEMYVESSLEKCIRIQMNAYSDIDQKNSRHIYLNGAKSLRPDLVNKVGEL